MPTLKSINAQANTNFRRTKELVKVLKGLPPPEAQEVAGEAEDAVRGSGDVPCPFTVEYREGAIFIDGPYDPKKYYRLGILGENPEDPRNPIQDVNHAWGGWPFEWSTRTLPDNPQPPPPPFKWRLQEETHVSRRWRNKRSLPAGYASTIYEGRIDGPV